MKRNETSLLDELLSQNPDAPDAPNPKVRRMDTLEHFLLALSVGLAILATLHVLAQGAGQFIPTH